MRHPLVWLGGLVGMAGWPQVAWTEPTHEIQLAAAPASAPVAPAVAVAAVTAVATEDRPPIHTLRLGERQVLARFIPAVRERRDLRDRALALWRAHFAAEADAIERRFVQEDDWRPAFADAAALIDDFLEASLLPRVGEFPAGEGEVWVESIDPRSGERVRDRRRARARPPILAPVNGKADNDASDKRRSIDKPVLLKGRKPARLESP